MSDPPPMTADAFAAANAVSRETLDRFECYARLLERWQGSVNLVSTNSMADFWRRHMDDSAQLYRFVPESARTLVDLGSGAGFPGLVLAILGVPDVHLVESDQRKAAFLREVARECRIPVQVHNCRIDALPDLAADVVTARALAPLSDLLALAQTVRGSHTICIFPKGRRLDVELTAANKVWNVKYVVHRSRTDPEGQILIVEDYVRVADASLDIRRNAEAR